MIGKSTFVGTFFVYIVGKMSQKAEIRYSTVNIYST